MLVVTGFLHKLTNLFLGGLKLPFKISKCNIFQIQSVSLNGGLGFLENIMAPHSRCLCLP